MRRPGGDRCRALLVAAGLIGVLATSGACSSDAGVQAGAPAGDPQDDLATSTVPEDSTTPSLSPEELRALNLHYADRIDFQGDPTAARAVADEVRAALGPLAATTPDPTVDQLRAALATWDTPDASLQVSGNAVKTAGVAFAFAVGGGCVFGSIAAGQVEAAVGGFIEDGGCLAQYGH